MEKINSQKFFQIGIRLLLFFTLVGLGVGLKIHLSGLLAAALVLIPMRDNYTKIVVVLNVFVLAILSLALTGKGNLEFQNGVLSYIHFALQFGAPLVVLLLFFKQGYYTRYLLLLLVPSLLFSPTWYYCSLFAYICHPIKVTRYTAAVLLILLSTVFFPLGGFLSFWFSASVLHDAPIGTKRISSDK